MLSLIFILSIFNANAVDLYEQEAKVERKQGAKATAAQKANKDLAPIFRCASESIQKKHSHATRIECLEKVSAFEKKAGKSFSKSKYPRKGLKKMVDKLMKYDASFDDQPAVSTEVEH